MKLSLAFYFKNFLYKILSLQLYVAGIFEISSFKCLCIHIAVQCRQLCLVNVCLTVYILCGVHMEIYFLFINPKVSVQESPTPHFSLPSQDSPIFLDHSTARCAGCSPVATSSLQLRVS